MGLGVGDKKKGGRKSETRTNYATTHTHNMVEVGDGLDPDVIVGQNSHW